MLTGNSQAVRLACTLVIALAIVAGADADDSSSTESTARQHPVFTSRVGAPAYSSPYQRSFVSSESSQHVIDKRFIGMSAIVMGLTIADLESTQRCLSNHTCRELNPMLPTSRVGMYAVNLPINAGAMYFAYRLKAGGHRNWWIVPALVSAGHGVGFAFKF